METITEPLITLKPEEHRRGSFELRVYVAHNDQQIRIPDSKFERHIPGPRVVCLAHVSDEIRYECLRMDSEVLWETVQSLIDRMIMAEDRLESTEPDLLAAWLEEIAQDEQRTLFELLA